MRTWLWACINVVSAVLHLPEFELGKHWMNNEKNINLFLSRNKLRDRDRFINCLYSLGSWNDTLIRSFPNILISGLFVSCTLSGGVHTKPLGKLYCNDRKELVGKIVVTSAFFNFGKGFLKKSELTTSICGLKNVFRKSFLNKHRII